ncbi:MAG: phosphoglucomutase/phosphomannomutase family protein, partial [Candidatus Omnitrophica bacterium]|nr:phosphoglucomutase/phosphomannomutase family protein [Candidatus Omnitrophota bacterium]
MQKITFGTDGFRGIIADNFTFANVTRIAAGIAGYLRVAQPAARQSGVIVGYDRRFLSDVFAERVARELSRSGIPVFLSKSPVPTPAVSCYIRKHRLPSGIIVTASHNPGLFNGIKIKNEFGASAGQEVTTMVEQLTE